MREGTIKNINLLSPVNLQSRYLYTKTVADSNKNVIYGLFSKHGFYDLTDSIYHIVTKREANRLDIIADKYYGNPQYWWMIAMANNIIDPFILVEGTTILIPNVDAFHQQQG